MADRVFSLICPAFDADGVIPIDCTCDGENMSPELNWIHPPDNTCSFVLIVDNPDASNETFTHWVLFDIPAETEGLPGKVSEIGVKGRNDFHQINYGGPCPPPYHVNHRYYFRLFALDVESLWLQAGASPDEVKRAMLGHIIDRAELIGRYELSTV